METQINTNSYISGFSLHIIITSDCLVCGDLIVGVTALIFARKLSCCIFWFIVCCSKGKKLSKLQEARSYPLQPREVETQGSPNQRRWSWRSGGGGCRDYWGAASPWGPHIPTRLHLRTWTHWDYPNLNLSGCINDRSTHHLPPCSPQRPGYPGRPPPSTWGHCCCCY